MKLLYLSLLSFLLVSTTAISMSGNLNLESVKKNFGVGHRNYAKLPELKENVKYPVVSAQSAIAFDVNSGVSLYEKNPDKKLLPASTTKIVTALVSLDIYQMDQVLKVGKVRVEGQKMGLIEGEEIKYKDLLDGLLIYSANDAAEVLAQNYIGGRDMFIALMNKKAKDLGMKNSHFTNPVGLDGSDHYSTARDLAIISKYAMRNKTFAEVVGTRESLVKSVDGKYSHKLVNINKLLGSVDGVLGVKTGWTENARENLVTFIERDDKKVMMVVLGSSDRFGETTELINWIYDNYEWNEVIPES